jgi:hypothetical protein
MHLCTAQYLKVNGTNKQKLNCRNEIFTGNVYAHVSMDRWMGRASSCGGGGGDSVAVVVVVL